REGEKERECVCVCVCMWLSPCVCLCVPVCVCVCVFVCEQSGAAALRHFCCSDPHAFNWNVIGGAPLIINHSAFFFLCLCVCVCVCVCVCETKGAQGSIFGCVWTSTSTDESVCVCVYKNWS